MNNVLSKKKEIRGNQVSLLSPEMLGKRQTKLREEQEKFFLFVNCILVASDKCFWKCAHPRSRQTCLRRVDKWKFFALRYNYLDVCHQKDLGLACDKLHSHVPLTLLS